MVIAGLLKPFRKLEKEMLFAGRSRRFGLLINQAFIAPKKSQPSSLSTFKFIGLIHVCKFVSIP